MAIPAAAAVVVCGVLADNKVAGEGSRKCEYSSAIGSASGSRKRGSWCGAHDRNNNPVSVCVCVCVCVCV